MQPLLRQVAGALPWGGFFILAPADVLFYGALVWIPLLVWRERVRATRHNFGPGGVARLCVVAAITIIAALLPIKHEDGRVGPLLRRESSLGELAVAGVIYPVADRQYDGVRVMLPSTTPTRREVIQAITQQTGFRASIFHCGNGATVLFGSGGGRIRVSASHNRPNQASAGNGAVAPRFHSAHFRRAVPEMRRWAL